jgi:hypothetical protein
LLVSTNLPSPDEEHTNIPDFLSKLRRFGHLPGAVERETHAIVRVKGVSSPYYGDGGDIQVDLDRGVVGFPQRCIVNFTKLYYVHHPEKVKSIGFISPESQHILSIRGRAASARDE